MTVKLILTNGQIITDKRIISIEPELEKITNRLVAITLSTKDNYFTYSKDNIDKVIIEDVG